MALKDSGKLTVTDLLIRSNTSKNPFARQPDEGSLENMVPFLGALKRLSAMPIFQRSAAASQVWKVVDFHFTRNGSPEQQLLTFKSDGKVYRRTAGDEVEVFPASTSFSALLKKPSVVGIADRLHVSDGAQYLIYDGWTWVPGGISAPAAAPTATLVAGSLTGNFKLATTAVRLVNGIRVHESNRSPISSAFAPAAQNLRIDRPSGLPSHATHWSVYMSELTDSEILRRVATVDKNLATTDISALPAGNSPNAPIRNDPPQPSRVLGQWKNRLAMRSEANPDDFWFSAYAEVKGLLNGAPEECVSGRSTGSITPLSISDLVNNWKLPDNGENIQAALSHNGFLWIFTDRNGYVVRGEGSLLDNRGLRDFFPQHEFSFGAGGPQCAISTPQGLIILSNERHLWLWPGGEETVDIGVDIQKELNKLTTSQLFDAELKYWESNGRAWLAVTLTDRIAIFNFQVRVQAQGLSNFQARNTQADSLGVWFFIGTQGAFTAPTALETAFIDGQAYLLSGHSDGSVRQLDTLMQPSHLGLSCQLGKTYLRASVLSSPTSIARTASHTPDANVWTEGKYLEIYHVGHTDTNTTGIRSTNPTVNVYYDGVDPDTPTNAVALTVNTVTLSKERRAWLKSSATSSALGSIAKRIQFEVSFTGTDTDAQTRPQLVNNEIRQLGFAWQPRVPLTQ